MFLQAQIYAYLFVLAGLALTDWAIHKAVDLTLVKAYVPPPTDEQFEEMVYLESDGNLG